MASAAAPLGVLINPTSGRGVGRAEGLKVLAELDALGVDYINLSAATFEEARRTAKAAVDAQVIDSLVVVGGDGMMHLGVNVCANSEVSLGLVSAGTGNDSARALGMPLHDSAAATRKLIAARANPRKVDLISAKRGEESFFAFGAVSAGFDSLVNRRANQIRFPKGPSRYQVALFLELAKFKSIKYQITVDGIEREIEAMLCSVANTPSYGGGMLITPEANIEDGQLDLFIVHKISRPELVKVFPKVYTGEHVSHPAVEIVRASEVSIRMIDSTGTLPLYSDGEAEGEAPFSAKVLAKALKVLA
jgi:diacylglycerol kinase (ATP)